MNLYRLRLPRGGYGASKMPEKWHAFNVRLGMLQASPGSQTLIAQRRAAKVAPPLYADPLEKEKRRQRNRARRVRQGRSQ